MVYYGVLKDQTLDPMMSQCTSFYVSQKSPTVRFFKQKFIVIVIATISTTFFFSLPSLIRAPNNI